MKYLAKDLIKISSGRKHIRSICGAPGYVPIVLLDNDSAPKFSGERWHYKTSGGKYIRHPSAYSKVGRSNMRYCPSTLLVEVGSNWASDKEFFSFEKRVDYLCYMLDQMGFEIVPNPYDRSYHIYHHSNSVRYLDLPLKYFRITAARLINLIVFS
jgi:hypothetical protein